MNKLDAYVAALELAIRALDSAFVRSNAAEVVMPQRPVSERWALPPLERDAAERAEIASYDVTSDHWGARLCLMSAYESLHGALRIISSKSAHRTPLSSAWRDAVQRAQEAARLAECAAQEFIDRPSIASAEAYALATQVPEAQPSSEATSQMLAAPISTNSPRASSLTNAPLA